MRRCANACDETDSPYLLAVDQILDQVIASVVDVSVDHVRDRGPEVTGQLHADVPADVANPDRLALMGDRRQPEPHVVSLIDDVACFLKADVLVPPEEVETRHGCVAIGRTEHEGFGDAPGGSGGELRRDVPVAGDEGRSNGVQAAHQDDIDGVARPPVRRSRAARQVPQPLLQLVVIQGRCGSKTDLEEAVGVRLQTRDRDDEVEAFGLFAQCMGAGARSPDQIDVERLEALIVMRVDEAGRRFAGLDEWLDLQRAQSGVELFRRGRREVRRSARLRQPESSRDRR